MKLKKGKYYIGDPGYVFEENWYNVLEKTNHFRNNVKLFETHNYFAHNTYWGDGNYSDNLGNIYSISSGLLGILPFSFIEIDNVINLNDSFFIIKDFDKPFKVKYNNGKFSFGEIKIQTK